MDVQKFKEVIKTRNETDDEYDYGVEMCNKEEIQILAEFVWISEIIDDLAEKTRSRELVECYKDLMNKYPKETKEYYIGFCVECAEDFLEDTDA